MCHDAVSVGGHVSVFLSGLGDAWHSQQNGVQQGPASGEEKNQTYNPEHKTARE